MRLVLQIFVVLCAALTGFAAGGALSAAYFVSPGAGLAGGAEVLFYGAAAALIAAVVAGFEVARMGGRTLVRLSVAAALFATTLLVWALLNQQGKDGDTVSVPTQPRTTSPVKEDGS